VRCVAVGLIRLFEEIDDRRFAIMAGLAASWFTGNNAAGAPMFDPRTGHGYDGLTGENKINVNAGAESTIEALYTILEIENHPLSRCWMHARAGRPERIEKHGTLHFFRLFETDSGVKTQRVVLTMNLAKEQFSVLEGDEIEKFLSA